MQGGLNGVVLTVRIYSGVYELRYLNNMSVSLICKRDVNDDDEASTTVIDERTVVVDGRVPLARVR